MRCGVLLEWLRKRARLRAYDRTRSDGAKPKHDPQPIKKKRHDQLHNNVNRAVVIRDLIGVIELLGVESPSPLFHKNCDPFRAALVST